MRKMALAAMTAAAVAFAGMPEAAEAQTHRSAFGLNGGGSWFSEMNRGADAADLTLQPGWIAGAQLERWFGNARIGLRLNGNFTDRPLRLSNGETETFGSMNTWFGDLDLMARILSPRPDRTFAPFVSLGFGLVHYDPPRANVEVEEANAIFRGDFQTQLAGVVGLGTDIFPGWQVGAMPLMFRLEAANHFTPESAWRNLETNERFGEVHNVRLTAGLHAMFEPIAPPPPPVAVAPEPEAVAPAPPEPEPAPPAEETAIVCVIDPAAPGGIRTVEVIHVAETDERFVIRDGQRVRFEGTLPQVTLAPETEWHAAGDPLRLEVEQDAIEFVPFGTQRVIEADELVFLGTVDGLPVYGSRAEIDARLAAAPRADLRATLRTDAEAWDLFRETEVLYVPAEGTGCVFVPLQRVEEVLPVRG